MGVPDNQPMVATERRLADGNRWLVQAGALHLRLWMGKIYCTPMPLARTIFSPPLSPYFSLRLLKFKICIRSTCENSKSTNWADRPRALFYSCIIVNWSHRFGFYFRGPQSLCLSSQYYFNLSCTSLVYPFLFSFLARNKFVCFLQMFWILSISANCENSGRSWSAIYWTWRERRSLCVEFRKWARRFKKWSEHGVGVPSP